MSPIHFKYKLPGEKSNLSDAIVGGIAIIVACVIAVLALVVFGG